MGRPFLEKFADVQWEINEEHLQAWKDGKTGFPIVDAAMRACNVRGERRSSLRGVGKMSMMIGRMDGKSSQDGGGKLHGKEPDARLA